MKVNWKRILYWAPRILSVLFALFLSLFAFDVFVEGASIWEQLLAFLIHLVPVYVVVIVLLLAWKWEWVGAVLFIGLGLFYLVEVWGKLHWSAYVAISGPLFLIGVLFLLNWKFKAQLQAG